MGRVILAFDGKPESDSALVWAAREAVLRGTGLVVLTVVDADVPDARAAEITDPIRRRVTDLLATGPVDHQVLRGHAASTIVHATAPDDLLVVGSRQRGVLAERLLGSVSHACLHAAPSSVVVVPSGFRTSSLASAPSVVVVGVDGSDCARHALQVADDEARLRRASLQVVNAVHWENIGEEWITPTVDDLLTWGQNLVSEQFAQTGVTGNPQVVHGRPDEVLTDASSTADLLVLGIRGRNPIVELLVGSTAYSCARRAACPVMVVRGG